MQKKIFEPPNLAIFSTGNLEAKFALPSNLYELLQGRVGHSHVIKSLMLYAEVYTNWAGRRLAQHHKKLTFC